MPNAGVGGAVPPTSVGLQPSQGVGAPPPPQQQLLQQQQPQPAAPKSRLELRMESKILSTRTPDQETEQGLVRNEEAIRKIRDSWIYKNIRARTNEFTEFKQVRKGITVR
jgi:hypothetical protein